MTKSAAYWEKRNNDRLNKVTITENQLLKRQAKAYKAALNNLDDKIKALYSDLMANADLSNPVRYIDLYQYEKYRRLSEQIKDNMKIIGKSQVSDIDDMIRLVYWNQLSDVAADFGKTITFDRLSQLQVDSFINTPYKGKHFSSRVWENVSKTASRLETDIGNLLLIGKNPAKITAAIAKDFGTSYSAAERLVRTESIHAYNAATVQGYKQAGVERYQFYAAEDERTCDECGLLHNQIFTISEAVEGINQAPIHPNCRCTSIPITDLNE